LLVGEIRDSETAQIAVQAALTGHLVFTTVHANTVFDVVGRFRQFGVDAYTFASAINGILAQRLVRRLCSRCAVPASVAQLAQLAEMWPAGVDAPKLPLRLLSPVGCESCRGTGYSGRLALGELLTLTPAIKSLVANQSSLATIQAEAASSGWKSMRQHALAAAALGLTSIEEVERVAL
jgi:general secretion pathway protein E